jgi:hypothetical protein
MQLAPIFLLDPPYQVARPKRDREPALGSILLLDTLPERPTTNAVKDHMDLALWCPLCLLAESDSGVRSTRRLARTCVVFDLDEAEGSATILRAVASRPRPTPSDLVSWIQRRTRIPTLGRTLSDLFTRPPIRRHEEAFLPYAVREQLRQLGDWGAVNWQLAARLAEVAADRSLLNRTLSAKDATAEDVRSSIDGLLGISEEEFRARYGWEWVLEASLRRSGFFERSSRPARPFTVVNGLAEEVRGAPRALERYVVGESGDAVAERRATA